MKYKIITKEFELTPALEDYVDKRMTKADKLLKKHEDLVSPADIKIEKEGGIFKVDITAFFKRANQIVKVEERNGDLYETIDRVTDSFERKVRKLKKKVQEHYGEPLEFPDELKNLQEDIKVVRSKRYDMSMMSTEEAMLQTEMLGHQFFVYRNSDTDEVNVIYQRKNKTFGIIEFND